MKNDGPVSLQKAFNANQAALMEIARLLGRGTSKTIDEADQRMALMLQMSQGIQKTILELKKQLKVDLEDRRDFVSSVMDDLENLDTLDLDLDS